MNREEVIYKSFQRVKELIDKFGHSGFLYRRLELSFVAEFPLGIKNEELIAFQTLLWDEWGQDLRIAGTSVDYQYRHVQIVLTDKLMTEYETITEERTWVDR